MSQAPDRNTGLPVRTSNQAQDQSFNQQQNQTTGPRTDTQNVNSQDRSSQSQVGNTSAVNTTPRALAALDSVIAQLMGTAARPALTSETLDIEMPLLVAEKIGGLAASMYSPGHAAQTIYRDPKTGRTFKEAEGKLENQRRMQEREQRLKAGAVEATPGGTPEMRLQQQQRQEEIARNRTTAAQYSKEAAFIDSQALVNKAIADSLEKVLPQIVAASEGAGTSEGSMRALLTQRAAEKAGVEGAALGANAAVAYGGINTQLSGVLEMLTRSDPNSPTALLLQAILGSKGLVSDSSTSQDSFGTSDKNQSGTNEIGAQNTLQDTSRQILEPLSALSNQTPALQAQERGNSTPTRKLAPSMLIGINEGDNPSNLLQDNTSGQVYSSGATIDDEY